MHLVLLAVFVFLGAGVPRITFADDTAETIAPIDDDEEYAVMAALLFPHEPEVPDELKGDKMREQLYLAEQRAKSRLSGLGLGWGSFRIFELTSQEQVAVEALADNDRPMIKDFNAKNARRWRLERERLNSRLPSGRSVTVVAEKDLKTLQGNEPGWEFKRSGPIRSSLTTLSRVGFSPDRMSGVVSIHHQADYEMGVGYRVYLVKSKKSGKWFIDGSARTRMY